MRKVVAVELVSVDGVMESPEEWAPPYSNHGGDAHLEQSRSLGFRNPTLGRPP
jgi:hypothetical protein